MCTKPGFPGNSIESICYILINWFKSKSDFRADMRNAGFTDEDFMILTRDILGEAG